MYLFDVYTVTAWYSDLMIIIAGLLALGFVLVLLWGLPDIDIPVVIVMGLITVIVSLLATQTYTKHEIYRYYVDDTAELQEMLESGDWDLRRSDYPMYHLRKK